MTLIEIIEQIESCNYECEAGKLENNVAWAKLKNRIEALNTSIGLIRPDYPY